MTNSHPAVIETFFTQMRPHLFAFTYRVCGDPQQAEDIVQESLVDAFFDFSEDPNLSLTPQWIFRHNAKKIRETLDEARKKLVKGEQLIHPHLTDTDFWLAIAKVGGMQAPRVTLKESFQIGFLSLVQRLPLEERLSYVAKAVMRWADVDAAHILESPLVKYLPMFKRAEKFMEDNYFKSDPIQWRGQDLSVERAQKFLDSFNAKNAEDFLLMVDPEFHCLLLPAPGVDSLVFCQEFFPRFKSCEALDFELNGEPVFALRDDREIQALFFIYHSPRGVVTILGYDLELLSPAIRTRVYYDESTRQGVEADVY